MFDLSHLAFHSQSGEPTGMPGNGIQTFLPPFNTSLTVWPSPSGAFPQFLQAFLIGA